MKRSEIIFCTVLVLLLFVISVRIGASNFNKTEAAIAAGETLDLTDGWTLSSDHSTGEKVSLPYQETSHTAKRIKLTHSASSAYAGLALSLYATNASVDVYVDNVRIYKSNTANGLTNLPSTGRRLEKKKLNTAENAEIGQIIMDLPSGLKHGQTISIVMERISSKSTKSNMELHSVSISKRDVAVIKIVRQSMFPLLCGVIILICAAVMQSLDFIRLTNHRRTRGLVIIALLSVDTILYSFVKTDVFYLFFGNRRFFLTLEEVCYILMPVFLTGFFFRGFKIHFPIKIRVLFYSSAAIALLDLSFFSLWDNTRSLLYQFHMLWKEAIILCLMFLLYKWKRAMPEKRQIFWDEISLSCLAVSVVANPFPSKIVGLYFLNTIQMVFLTLYFVFMTAQHVQIMLFESQSMSQQRAQILKDQNLKLLVANQEAETARREAILANEAKSRFLANMSHEIRTPINAVLGMDEIILRESDDPSIREYARDIQSAGKTLLSIINNILDFSKIESGNMELILQEYSFGRLITDLKHMISQRAVSKGLDLVLSVDETIPDKLYGDDIRLRQCLMNLLTNAVKYTPEGNVYFTVSGKTDGDKAILHFEVRDTGIGIKKEDLPKLFHAYERIEESRNRNVEGTGLGMNITMQMLSLMGTSLEVDSVYGEGSTFYFDVEQGIIDNTPVGDIEAWHDSSAPENAHEDAFIAPDAHILVVDDNAINRKVLIGLLSQIQLQIDEAESGMQAIEKAKERKYDLIFMDHMMPMMDGVEAMQTIRSMEDSPNAHTRIFVLTANAVTGAREMYLEAGFDGFLSKPILSDKLEETLRDNLPEELILPAPKDMASPRKKSAQAGPPEDLPMVDGLDWTFAWQHLPGEEMLAETLRQFYELILIQANKLNNMYDNLDKNGILDSYRIHVHGMKGLAATVGIIPLAGSAKILEFAARDGRTDIIDHLHPIFIDEWCSYREKLKGVFGIGEAEESTAADLPPASYRPTLARLEMLRQAMDDFDIDQGDEIIQELKQYRYPDDVTTIIDQLSGAVADIDNDLVSSLVDNYIEIGEWSL